MKEWYDDIRGGEVLFTCVSGEMAGCRMLQREGEIVWKSPEISQDASIKLIHNLTDDFLVENSRYIRENVSKKTRLVICGAGYVGEQVAVLGKILGFEVTIIDEREEYVKKAAANTSSLGICRNFGEALESILSDETTYFVIATRGHSRDIECLDKIMKKNYAYVGMMGSYKRCSRAKEEMKTRGYNTDRLSAPIGLDIKAETPEEIAVSIIGEIISVKNSRLKAEMWTYITDRLKENRQNNTECVLATIISKSGSAPRSTGTRMLIGKDGINVGTIGGGYIESKVLEMADEMMSDNGKSYHLGGYGTIAEDENEGCGGKVEVFMEKFT